MWGQTWLVVVIVVVDWGCGARCGHIVVVVDRGCGARSGHVVVVIVVDWGCGAKRGHVGSLGHRIRSNVGTPLTGYDYCAVGLAPNMQRTFDKSRGCRDQKHRKRHWSLDTTIFISTTTVPAFPVVLQDFTSDRKGSRDETRRVNLHMRRCQSVVTVSVTGRDHFDSQDRCLGRSWSL